MRVFLANTRIMARVSVFILLLLGAPAFGVGPKQVAQIGTQHLTGACC